MLRKPKHNHLQRGHHEVFDKLHYQECPHQINGIVCGLFCAGIVLHILVGKTIDRDTFSQEHVTELRSKLGDHFMGAGHNQTNKTNHQPTNKVVRDCFPSLRGTTIMSEHGVEDVTLLHIPDNVNIQLPIRLQVQSPQRNRQPELWRMHLFQNITTVMTMTTTVLRAKMTNLY